MKKTTLLASAITLTLLGSVVGCSQDTSKEEVKKEQVKSQKEKVKDLAKEIGTVKNPLFKEVKLEDLKDDEKSLAKVLSTAKDATGISKKDDLFILVAQEGTDIRYVTETHEDKKINVYLSKEEVDKKKNKNRVILAKVEKSNEREIWFFDAKTREPIQLEPPSTLPKEAPKKEEKK